jgi:glycosyltransferase involved in cell wall biosynthesis
MQGIMAALARRHRITALSLISPEYDRTASLNAMREYCSDVVLVPSARWGTPVKRLIQLRSLLSTHSYVRLLHELRPLRKALHETLTARAYDVVTVELPFLALHQLSMAPPGKPPPRLILDEHNIEFDLARQQAGSNLSFARRIFNGINWRKQRREELHAWRRFDGVSFCSAADESRARALVPSLRSAVVPNAVDVDYFRPRPGDPAPDGQTVIFFGAINYFPNVDGLLWLLREVWPLVEKSHPRARLKIVGQQPTDEILAFRGPRVEVTGMVADLRPHLAAAALSIAPLRIGGGTRFKILEGMAMSKPIVSTAIGAEGIEGEPGRHFLIAQDPASFAAAIGRLLDDPGLGAELGKEGRALVERRYSWDAAVSSLEELYARALAGGV